MKKTIKRAVALVMSMIILSTNLVFASSMKDVSSSHWAYNEIMEMQRRGLLVTSSQGQFFPNNYVTYFEFSKILAKATGYEDEKINPNMDPALKQTIRTNYERQKPIIEAHQKNYKHWQKDANEEIAYLLGKGYLVKEDLGKFMSKSTSGVESKRGVRKQEAVVYLVRILHKAETAKKEYVNTGFVDEAKIGAEYRPYVAYFKKLGLINGNEKGEFGPTDPITRATLSKMLIDTLKIRENPVTPQKPQPEPQKPAPVEPKPQVPTDDQAIEGKLTKMISKGNNGYYVVIEKEPSKIHTYSLESTAKVVDRDGYALSLSSLKERVDNSKDNDVNVVAKISLIGTTEYITDLKLIESVTTVPAPAPEKPKPQPEEDKNYVGKKSETGTIYSVLMAPIPEVTIQLDDGTKRTYKITYDTELYSKLLRRDIPIWDLRINQTVDIDVSDRNLERLVVKSAAPPLTLTGTIVRTTTSGDEIDLKVAYDSITKESNVVRTIKVPMLTQITDGRVQRARKDFKPNMQIVVVFGENGEPDPEQIIIVSN